MKVTEAIATSLKAEGVEHVFCYPYNPIIEAVAAADIRPIVVRQERTAVHMADALSRTTSGDDVGVVCLQYGPGTENAFGGVAQAYADSVPLVVLPAGFSRDQTDVQPRFNATHNYREITKSCEQVTVPEETPSAIRRAFSQATNGRPRPALVEFPGDIIEAEIDTKPSFDTATRSRPGPDVREIQSVVNVLETADRPVIYAGQGVHYAQAWPELRELAERLAAPVCTSIQGKSAFPETHELALGTGGKSMPKTVRHFLDEADVIFGIGCSFSRTSFGVTIPTDDNTIIHSTLDPADIDKDIVCDHALVGDAKLVLDSILSSMSIDEQDRSSVVAEINRVYDEWFAEWEPKLTSDAVPMTPYRVINDLQQTVDVENTIITHDSGSPRDQLVPFWKAVEPMSYIGWGKSTQLGYGLGLAMGAKIAHPDKLCINVWGDAAIGMTGMDFETAVREEIPILSILFNNFSMAVELPKMQVSTEKYRTTDISGNYADMATAFGGYGERVEQPDEIVSAIERGIEQVEDGTPALLEFLTSKEIDYSIL